MFISILGRQPGISLAELEVLFGADKITRISAKAALVNDIAPDVSKLGGSIKIIDNVYHFEALNWQQTTNMITKFLKDHALNFGKGKMNIGLSVYDDVTAKPKDIKKYLINTKKEMRSAGLSVRVVPNKKVELNSAQVLHNKLTAKKNAEFVLIKTNENNMYWIGRTHGVQDIEALARRDQGRPKRDSRVGMLPPKLALIMVNLGTGGQRESPSHLPAPISHLPTILDPFCGTGVLLQEAILLGHGVYGTDLEQRMIEYTKDNLQWLVNNHLGGIDLTFQPPAVRLEQGDARYHKWAKPFDAVVCETYLGPPMNSAPAPDKLAVVRSEVNVLLKTFLRNIHKQLNEGSSLCVAVPAWRVGGKILHLNLLDDLEKLGYTRRVLKHATFGDLVYFRPDQTVAREILILERN